MFAITDYSSISFRVLKISKDFNQPSNDWQKLASLQNTRVYHVCRYTQSAKNICRDCTVKITNSRICLTMLVLNVFIYFFFSLFIIRLTCINISVATKQLYNSFIISFVFEIYHLKAKWVLSGTSVTSSIIMGHI